MTTGWKCFSPDLAAYQEQTRPVADYYQRTGRIDFDQRRSADGRRHGADLQNSGGSSCLRSVRMIRLERMAIVCKSAAEIEKMRQSGHIVARFSIYVRTLVAPGRHDHGPGARCREEDCGTWAKPAFKGYYDYPCVLCTSVNEEIVHGIPSEKRALKEGDIVSIDCGAVLDGYYGDCGDHGSRGER
jgi:Xaa-Pro aminopeptidase